jgi:stress-induced-phosphoprotein 1
LYSNRSACYYNSNEYLKALEDGEKCIEAKADWGKGYQRKAMALHALRRFDEATEEYTKGIELDPANDQLKQGFAKCQQDVEAEKAEA